MKLIPLSQGKISLVSDEDYHEINKWTWNAEKHGNTYYAKRNPNDKNKHRSMHRMVMNATPKQMIDHIDGNGLNNQRNNLRFCSNSENQMNRTRKQVNATSKYIGVTLHKQKSSSGKLLTAWVAGIKIDGKRKHLGAFKTEIEAAKAYNEAALKFRKEFITLNKI